MSVSTGANTLPPEAISAETFASLRSMSPMDKSAIPSISLTLVTQCPNSHMIGKWTTSPSMRKIGRNGLLTKMRKMMTAKMPHPNNEKIQDAYIIIIYMCASWIFDFLLLIASLSAERRPCDLFLFYLSLLIII